MHDTLTPLKQKDASDSQPPQTAEGSAAPVGGERPVMNHVEDEEGGTEGNTMGVVEVKEANNTEAMKIDCIPEEEETQGDTKSEMPKEGVKGETASQPNDTNDTESGHGKDGSEATKDTQGDANAPKEKAAQTTAPVVPPPPPVLKGTLSYNIEMRRHMIRGMWNYENSKDFAPQRFDLLRNLGPDEDPTELPKNGEFHGSFSLAYFHTTSKGKRKERSKVINESGVNIVFTKVQGKEKEYNVEGKGNNQFGVFALSGTASGSLHEGDPTYNIVLRKRYVPSPNGPAAPLPDEGKKSKKRKLSAVGSSGAGSDAMDVDQEFGPMPPPSQSYPSHVVCLRGKLAKEQNDIVGGSETVHRIRGMWSSGLDLILADPENANGMCNRFEYEHRCTLPTDAFPVSGRYTGWFFLNNEDGSRTQITEKDVTLKFKKNNMGFYNVEGRGSNFFGKYRITGTLTNDNIITIFRHFQPVKIKAKAHTESTPKLTGAGPPPPLHGKASKSSITPQEPPKLQLSLDDVVVPETGKDDVPDALVPPEQGTYSAVSRGVLRVNDEGAHTCAGKWAMSREHYTEGQTNNFNFRLEAHFAAAAAKELEGKDKNDAETKKEETSAGLTASGLPPLVPPGTNVFPVDSALYKGSFQMKRGAAKHQTVIDQQIVLKFRKNKSGTYNVHGKGINSIGQFSLVGTLILSGNGSGHVELYRMYPVVPQPAPAPVPAPTGNHPPLTAGRTLPTKANMKATKLLKGADGLGNLNTDPVLSGGLMSGSTVAHKSSILPHPVQRSTSAQRRPSGRQTKLPSRLEEDDPEAQLARLMEKCNQTLRFLREKDVASGSFFQEPVDPVAHGIPTYHQIISNPMDLGTIQRKLTNQEIGSPEEFARLVRLVFENAMTFNVDPSHVVHQAARNLLIMFNQKFRDIERATENMRKSYKPLDAELKKKEKENAKLAKKKARRRTQGGADAVVSKKSRLEQAEEMIATNSALMSAIVSAAPPSGGNVTRAEFNLLLQMIQQMQQQIHQSFLLLGTTGGEPEGVGAVIPTTMDTDSVFSASSDTMPLKSYGTEKKKNTKKKDESGSKASEVYSEPPVVVENLKPLTLKEQEVLTETINQLSADHLPGVIQIIRESAHLDGDEEEIDLEIDQLDTTTQRKLQKYVMKHVKPPRRTKGKSQKKTKAASATAAPVKQEPIPDAPAKKTTKPAAPKSSPKQKNPEHLFAYENKDDSDSDSEPEEKTGPQNGSTDKPKDTFKLGDENANDFALPEDDDDDDHLGHEGIGTNWSISKTSVTSSKADKTDDDGWGAARQEAVASKAREEERKAREDKLRAEAEQAKNQRLADAAARGDEIRAQQEANEARLKEQQERGAEEAKKAARDAAREKKTVQQTVDLDEQRKIMRDIELSIDELGGSSSPSSDFGF